MTESRIKNLGKDIEEAHNCLNMIDMLSNMLEEKEINQKAEQARNLIYDIERLYTTKFGIKLDYMVGFALTSEWERDGR